MMTDFKEISSLSKLKAANSYTSTSLLDPVKLRLGKQGLCARPPQTIPQFFRECCRKYEQLPALMYESSSTVENTSSNWTTLSYAEYAEQVQQAALLLLHVGLEPRTSLGILAGNYPEWFYAQMGALRAGAVVAGIYPSNSAEAVYHVLETSEATVCVVDDAVQMAKVRAVRSRLPRLRAVIQLHEPFGDFVGTEPGYYRWQDLARMEFDAPLLEELERREENVAANECAMLIYTSGTVGMPKGVMLSHDAIVYDAKAVSAAFSDLDEGAQVSVTYLPLNHIAAQIFDFFMAIDNGGCVYFADKNALKGTLSKTLFKARPTIIFGVPRIFEKIQEKLMQVESKSTTFSKYIMNMSRQIIERYHLDVIAGKPTSTLKYWLAKRVTNQVKAALGFDRCKYFVVGGAPISDELKHFFLSLDMPLNDVYGLSETGGAVTMHMQLCNLDSVGKALEGMEVKINNPDEHGHGEICLRARSCFMGYLNDPEKTMETIKDDGWLHSGDVGYLDTKGNLIVSGRIKELVITAGGENIPPVLIEDLVKRELPAISNAILVGDRKKYLTMLLTLKTDFELNTGLPLNTLRTEAITWLQSLGLDFKLSSEVLGISADLKPLTVPRNVEVKPHPKVLTAIEEGIKRANSHAISHAQRVQKFVLLPYDFSLPTGELGPTLKIRRTIIQQKYADVIEGMYK